jgi:signal transduction histidine kinase
VINTIINNAHQYTKDKIVLAAQKQNGFLRISVIDNGPGYPKEMLEDSAGSESGKRAVNFNTGSTGLGLFFARTVAQIHKNGASSGYISLANDEKTGGGRFSIHLP